MSTNKSKKRKIIIDFEVLSEAGFWLVVMKDYYTKKEHIIINDREELIRVYNKNKDAIWIGYNIRGYDQYIFKAILAGIDPCMVSNKLIKQNIPGWQIDRKLNYQKLNIFELSNQLRSLKELELFMGEDIRESSVSFDLDRYPNEEEIKELVSYCLHDVRMTYKVFETLYFEYEAQEGLIDYFNLDEALFNKTKAQLSAEILEARKPEEDRDDTFDFDIVDTLQLSKYDYVRQWYKDPANKNFKSSLNTPIYGVDTDFGWGGLHAAVKNFKAEGYIVNSDVSSFYPAIMIEYNLISRNVKNPNKFREIRDTRIEMKKNKDPQEKSLKIVLNSTFGASKDINNELYDPRNGNAICVNGQLLLLDLIEKVELEFGDKAQFIQGNTDGVMFYFESRNDVLRYLEICEEWSNRTRMGLEHDFIDKIVQKDVNNYIFVANPNGCFKEEDDNKAGNNNSETVNIESINEKNIKSKGAYVKKLSLLDNDLPIVNRALVNKLVYGIDIETTINNANDLIDFQKCVKISRKYSHAIHGTQELNLKVLRVFASKRRSDGSVMKVKEGKNAEKIGNTPENAFIDNENIIGKTVPEYLDKEWYIKLANKRLNEFLPPKEYTLFDLMG